MKPVLFDHIEARQKLENTAIDDAVVVVKKGFRAKNVTFDNVAIVCEDEEIADVFRKYPSIHPTRIFVGGMTTAIRVLALAKVSQ